MRVLEALAMVTFAAILFITALIAASLITQTEPNLLYALFGAVVGYLVAASIYQGAIEQERERHKAEMALA